MKNRWKNAITATLLLACCGLFSARAQTPAADKTADSKLALRLLYIGVARSDRERDFVGFLRQHFKVVNTADITKFTEDQAKGFDVMLIDFDGDAFKTRPLRLSNNYRRATVTIGVMGAFLCDSLQLKTGYT